jgi:hypothetical protein
MIFKSRANINEELWNNCIANSINSLVYANTWYLDAIVENWDAYVWEKNGAYLAVFPIPNRNKFGVKYIYPPFFIQQLGLFSINDNIEVLAKEAIDQLEIDFKFTEINLNWRNNQGDKKVNVVLSLSKDYKDLLLGFSNNHKRNIKKSEKYNYDYKSNVKVKSIVRNFRNDRGADISTLKDKDYLDFINLCDIAEEKGVLETRGVFENEVLITGAVFMKYGNRLIFLFSGNSKEGKTSGGLFNLLNLVIKEYADFDLLLDFEGSTNEGLERFYKGFGGVEECYYFYKKNNLPKVLKWLKK